MEFRIVAGLIAIATRNNRFAPIIEAEKPNRILSKSVNFGERPE